MSEDAGRPRARRARQRVVRGWRLVSQTGARVVPLSRVNPRVRAKVMLPSLFTLGNMVCGFSAVLMAFQGRFGVAAVLIAASIVLDISDGAVARAVGAITPFGLQFDSLADLVSFGIAPAVLVYTWALPSYPQWAWTGAMFWRACAAYRLARFNVTIDPMADKRYFIGLPSPGAAGVVIATVFAIDQPLQGPLLPIAAGVLPAALMATSYRFRSFRGLLSTKNPLQTFGLLALVLVGLVLAPRTTGIVIAYGYVLTSPLGGATAPLRRRWFGPDAVAPPRVRMPSVIMPVQPDPVIDGEAAVEADPDEPCGPSSADPSSK
ncbi:CDP-alcohol phosphatidyltransferase family protein [Intrasporangium calvum]|uniref:CDP-diacylglycerol--serine O-phosphatidyltransferase n=1 Tax=Intrasporangium calvum (strain ATCC 23552 / DSM 43043 / JCM 3097 / NBRC 12989 / NCIMB 10167 / NRRL B-3866 / 7 KIP) TaxID=710696 RepID=E6SA05_INTC7|nr:phosphatidylcholine/phosphatidylserine synthase [Intrasporangium calvum]ADU48215.1 CDP-diacylglycerol--serine O-phosphatidyltransferase [Intrasporangium calvum DSM 43043]